MLQPRKLSTRESLLTSKVLLGQLLRYPRMLIRGASLPPFIFPPCAMKDMVYEECAVDGMHQCLPEALVNCCTLTHMVYTKTPANTPFVWRTVYAEVERLLREVSHVLLVE